VLRTELRRCLVSACAAALVVTAIPGRAADESVLRRVKGAVGYSTTQAGTVTPVSGSQSVSDAFFAVTGGASAGYVQLVDSSIIGIGSNTNVQVGAFRRGADGDGTTITVPAAGGTLRFDIRRPPGGRSNYIFTTPTSSASVRGTVGLVSLVNGQTTYACLACEEDSVTVTVGAQTFRLRTGQTLIITAAGIATLAALTTAILSSFSGAGVSTSAATGTSAATAGVGASTGAAAAGGVTAAAAGAAAVAGIAAAASSSQSNGPALPTPIPTVPGNATIQGLRR
jgi:hypothetical protein